MRLAKRRHEMLGAYCDSRDNNFNLLRIVAATLVLFTHSFGMTGNGSSELLASAFGMSFGSWAVDIFFVASGFLIAKSWDRTKSVRSFVTARIARIYPGLWVCVVVCVVGIGPAFTTLPLLEYSMHLETIKFVVENSTLILNGVWTSLPGTFVGQSVGVVYPLWTMPYEIKMYLVLLGLGWSGWLYRRNVVPVIIIAAFSVYAWYMFEHIAESRIKEFGRFFFFFFSGSYCYLRRDRIPLRAEIALGGLLLIGLSMLFSQIVYRNLVLSLATPYLVMAFAFLPSGPIRRYNHLGDYSFGLYIYGAPVQNVVLAMGGGESGVFQFFALSLAIALAVAALSWHLVEVKAMRAFVPRSGTGIAKCAEYSK